MYSLNEKKANKSLTAETPAHVWQEVVQHKQYVVDKRSLAVEQCKLQTLTQNHAIRQLKAMPYSYQQPIQRATSINHTSGNYSYQPIGFGAARANEKVGVRMVAKLDPEDPVIGSSTGDPQKDFIRALRARFPRDSMIRGHLLNHDLGGFGVHENLFPITAKANSRHLHNVEKQVKNALYDANQSVDREGVFYRVNVSGAMSDETENPVSTFECTAFKIPDVENAPNVNGDQLLDVDIVSSPHRGAGRPADHENARADVNSRDYDETGRGMANWKHGSRSGKRNFDDIIASGKITISDADSAAGGDAADFQDANEALLFMDEHDDEVINIIEISMIHHGLEDYADFELVHALTALGFAEYLLVYNYLRAAQICGQDH